jgi:hypothetical protein
MSARAASSGPASPRFAAPKLVLSARALSGVSRAPRDRMLEMSARTHEPEALAVTLSKAIDAGAEAVLVAPSPQLRAALAELQRVVPLLAVLPAIEWHEALELDPGLAPLIARARRRASMGARIRAGFTRLMRLPAALRGDWHALLPVLLELEVSQLRRGELAGVVLSADFADPALAAGNAKMFSRAVDFVHKRFAVPVGIETRNLGSMLDALAKWGVAPDFVVSAVNPAGLGMKPNVQEALDAMRRSPVPVIATGLRAGGSVTLGAGVDWAREQGAHGIAPDLVEFDDVGDLKELELRGM